MGKIRRKIAFFTIPEYEKEQDWLERQHRNGWKLVNATLPGIYKFVACEPEDVVYQLDYNQDGIAHKAEYVQMFQDCGWEYITDMAGYSYFRKPVNQMVGKEEIFCDDASRMDMIERVFKGRMIPLLVIFFAVIIPQFFIQISIDSLANKALAGMFAVLFVLYLVLFIQFGTQYLQLKKRLEK